MLKARNYKCSTCARYHARPTGKNCQWANMELQQEPEVAETHSPELAQTLLAITTQMDALSKKMEAMENRTPATTPDTGIAGIQVEQAAVSTTEPPQRTEVPSTNELRRDYDVGREVNRRLAEMDLLDDTTDTQRSGTPRLRGKRSGAARTVQDTIVHDIYWPHFHIYTPPGAEPMTYPALSILEFTYGYMHMVDQPDSKLNRQVMWEILKDLMEDAVEYPWQNVKNLAGSHVENDRMEWSDTEKIGKLRVKNSQKHETVNNPASQQTQSGERLKPCAPYQQGTCTEKADHGGLKHMCANCYKVKSVPYPHPEMNCRRKNTTEQPKNGKGGE